MSRNKEYLETKNTSNKFNGRKIKYQPNKPKNLSMNLAKNQDNLVTSLVKGFSSVSDSSSTAKEATYKAPNVQSEEQNMTHKSTKGYFGQNDSQINLNERAYYAN